MKEKLLTLEMLNPPGTTRNVIVDGIKAKCVLGPFGTWSERICLNFEEKHPIHDMEFMTKYFEILEPGILKWGSENQQMEIEIIDEEISFDKNAAAHSLDSERDKD